MLAHASMHAMLLLRKTICNILLALITTVFICWSVPVAITIAGYKFWPSSEWQTWRTGSGEINSRISVGSHTVHINPLPASANTLDLSGASSVGRYERLAVAEFNSQQKSAAIAGNCVSRQTLTILGLPFPCMYFVHGSIWGGKDYEHFAFLGQTWLSRTGTGFQRLGLPIGIDWVVFFLNCFVVHLFILAGKFVWRRGLALKSVPRGGETVPAHSVITNRDQSL